MSVCLSVRPMEQLGSHWIKKVKWSRYRPGMAQRVGRGIALLFHDRGTRRGWVVSSTPRPHFTPRKDPVPILHEAGWAPLPVWTRGKSLPHRDSIPDRPARSSVAIPTELPGSLPLDRLSLNLIFEDFSELCHEISSVIKIRQAYKLLHMKTNMHFWSYLFHLFLEWETFQTKLQIKSKHTFLCSGNFFSKIMSFIRQYGKKNTVDWVMPQMTRAMRIACWATKATNSHTHTHTHTYTSSVIFIAACCHNTLLAQRS